MSAICFSSVRGQPGCSTSWLLCAVALAASGREVVACEANPDGNDVAVTLDLGDSPGLVSLAAALHARRAAVDLAEVASAHGRVVGERLVVVPGPVPGEEAAGAVAEASGVLADVVEGDERVWLFDTGRLSGRSPALALARRSLACVLVCRPTPTEALALPARVEALVAVGCRPVLLVVGKGVWPASEVAAHGGVELVGVFPSVPDPAGAVHAVMAGRRGRVSLLWRAAVDAAATLSDRVSRAAVLSAAEPLPVEGEAELGRVR